MLNNIDEKHIDSAASDSFSADTEEELFRNFLDDPFTQEYDFNDPLFARVYDAFLGVSNHSLSKYLDLAVLIRQCLRRVSIRDNASAKFRVNGGLIPLMNRLDQVGIKALKLKNNKLQIEATPWTPTWLSDSDRFPVDKASLAGSSAGVGCRFEELPADPFFEEATGYSTYRSTGQRAAVRAIASMPSNGTLIALLPTGSGKTEVILALNNVAQRRKSIIVIVPTTALAYDFDRRFKKEFSRRNVRVNAEDLVFVWTGDTNEEQREDLRSKLIEGIIPILVTSPESLSGSLLKTVRLAADSGRIGGFIVDEAHLISAWGRAFRPEFQLLGSIRDDLLRRSLLQNGAGFKTALLSATLGPSELIELHDLFGKNSSVSLVAANAIRSELDIWIAEETDRLERNSRVIEALKHLPRPAIVYVNTPKEAKHWESLLVDEGFTRLAIVTGPTAGKLKKEVLEGLRSGRDNESKYDIVIGTSAFGLGIDNDQIRTVIHACLPENINRWYQEVGRGGRDGHYSSSILIPAYGDKKEAEKLSVVVLKPETAHKRWALIWESRVNIDNKNYIDVNSIELDGYRGSYNRQWNAQVLQGLESLRCIQRALLPNYEAALLGLDIGDQKSPRQWETIDLLDMGAHSESFFKRNWDEWRQPFVDESRSTLSDLTSLIHGSRAACSKISDAYCPNEKVEEIFGIASIGVRPKALCGRCPGCRSLGSPSVIESPPRFQYYWQVGLQISKKFEEFVYQCSSDKNLVLVHSEDIEVDAEELADLFYKLGVRVFAGIKKKAGRGDLVFWDNPDVLPANLPPLPSFIVPTVGTKVSALWDISYSRPVDQSGRTIPTVILLERGASFGRNSVENQISTSAKNIKSILRSLMK
ncbi:protein DpdF [Gammaproteobacteria bacterium]|nr:protein DpdF [Gammaproteobacteria bacterium]